MTRGCGCQGIFIRTAQAGGSHTAALSGDLQVYTFGAGGSGRLGHGALLPCRGCQAHAGMQSSQHQTGQLAVLHASSLCWRESGCG